MNKLVLKRAMLFIGLLVVGLLVFPGAWIGIQLLNVCDDAMYARAWLDENGNGQRESSELPMKGVCVVGVWPDAPLPSMKHLPDASELAQICDKSQTDSEGWWRGPFLLGTCCDSVYVFAKPPEGFQATTPLAVHSCGGDFGVAPIGSSPQLSNEDYTRVYTDYFKAQERSGWLVVLVILAEVILSAIGSIKLIRT